MTQLKVDTITDAAGTAAPDLEDGLTINGAALSTVNTAEYYSSGTEPSSPKNGAIWWDTANDKVMIYVNDAWYEIQLGASAASWVADVSNFSYDSKSFSVFSQESSPQGIAIKSDGTKMYICGQSQDIVFQYSLSTAYDVSTASYDSVYFSVLSQTLNPQSVKFNDDGTKMYVEGTDSVLYEYDLSTAWDVSSASYNSVNFNIGTATGTSSFQGHFWSLDGTKIYFVSTTTDYVYQVDCSTAFDLSTASYNSKYFDVSSQDTSPLAVACSGDGTKFYVIGASFDYIFQYSASTAFDVSTLSYDSSSFSISSQTSAGQDIAFSTDGTKFYVMDSGTDTVYQYSTGL